MTDPQHPITSSRTVADSVGPRVAMPEDERAAVHGATSPLARAARLQRTADPSIPFDQVLPDENELASLVAAIDSDLVDTVGFDAET